MNKLLSSAVLLLCVSACVKQAPERESLKQASLAKENQDIPAAKNSNNISITICHQQPNGSWQLKSINLSTWPTHQSHGDVRLDDVDGDGYVPTNQCGFGTGGDCDDNNSFIHPSTAEICNGIDDNCNGIIDESCYPAVILGNQVWMTQNLDVDHYRNGDPIPESAVEWNEATQTGIGVGYYYSYNPLYGPVYGKLFNWYAVHEPRGLAPAGWHIPTSHEWNLLLKFLDPATDTANTSSTFSFIAGGFMKESGLAHWASPNAGATNSSGFTALPGGWRDDEGTFSQIGNMGTWWSANGSPGGNPQGGGGPGVGFNYLLRYDNSNVSHANRPAIYGLSVRCVRD